MSTLNRRVIAKIYNILKCSYNNDHYSISKWIIIEKIVWYIIYFECIRAVHFQFV